MIPGQVIVPAAAVGLGFLCVMGVSLVVVMVWAGVFWWRDRRHNVGPDALLLMQDLDAHLDQLVLDDPEVKAGLARLDAAGHGEQQRGEAS